MGLKGRRAAGLFLLALLLIPAGCTGEGVTVSDAVQLLARTGTADEAQEAAAQTVTVSKSEGYAYSSSSGWSDRWSDIDASYYRVRLTDASGRVVDHATVEPVVTYDKDGKAAKKDYYWRTELVTGLYLYERTGYGADGSVIAADEIRVHFTDSVSLWLAAGQRTASAAYSRYGVHTFKWTPQVDWEGMQVTSSRYRIRITDDGVDAQKDFASSVVLDTYTAKAHWEIDKKDLPVGSYTVKVWCYGRGEGDSDPYVLHLVIRNPWAKYDYNLKEDLNITPGKAITRQHAAGSKDMTLYGTVALTTEETPGTQLRLGGETLEVSCGGAPVAASVAGDALTLRADGTTWRISLKALHTLRDSGINTLRLSLPDGSIRQLETDLEPSGRQYGLLRAAGLVSKDFTLCPDPEGDGWTVEADGRAFDLAGTELIPRTAKEAGE